MSPFDPISEVAGAAMVVHLAFNAWCGSRRADQRSVIRTVQSTPADYPVGQSSIRLQLNPRKPAKSRIFTDGESLSLGTIFASRVAHIFSRIYGASDGRSR